MGPYRGDTNKGVRKKGRQKPGDKARYKKLLQISARGELGIGSMFLFTGFII